MFFLFNEKGACRVQGLGRMKHEMAKELEDDMEIGPYRELI